MNKKSKNLAAGAPARTKTLAVADDLLKDLRTLIDQARSRVAQTVNTELVALHWHIGEKIRVEILKQGRAEYGKQVLETLGRQLTLDYGRGFDHSCLARMV
jgi:hypothetical protein